MVCSKLRTKLKCLGKQCLSRFQIPRGMDGAQSPEPGKVIKRYTTRPGILSCDDKNDNMEHKKDLT